MIVTTTTAIEGRPVAQYLGVVTGEVIVGANEQVRIAGGNPHLFIFHRRRHRL